MSMGYGAICKLSEIDEFWIMYAYTSYNLNLGDSQKAIKTLDGLIIISKDFFPDPEIIRKRIKKPSGKKVWIEKKKYEDIDLMEYYTAGKINIENSSHCWQLTESGIDIMALKLLFYLQIEYQKTDKIPKEFEIFS